MLDYIHVKVPRGMRREIAKLAIENMEYYRTAGCGMAGVVLTAIQTEIDRHKAEKKALKQAA